MAIIQSGATADLWTINPISNAGRVTIYDSLGNELAGVGVALLLNVVLDALNEDGTLNLSGQANTSIQLWGSTGTFTVSFQANIDGINWFSVFGKPLAGGVAVSSASGDGVWFVDTSGYKQIRARVTSFTSGSSVLSMIADPEQRDQGTAISIDGASITIGKYADNTPNPTDKMAVLPARANTSAPTWTDGYIVPLSVDTSGSLRVTGTVNQGTSPWITKDTIADGYLQSILANQTNGTQLISGSGTAGASATGVITVQGISGGTALPVSITSGGAINVDGYVTTSAPSYTNNTTNYLSLDTTGNLRVTVAGTGTAGSGSSTNVVTVQGNASGTPIPISGTVNTDGYVTAASPSYTNNTTNYFSLDTSGNLRVLSNQGTSPWATRDSIADGYLQSILANQTNGTQHVTVDGYIHTDPNIVQHIIIDGYVNTNPNVIATGHVSIDGYVNTNPVVIQGTSPWVISQPTASALNATVVGTGVDNTTNSTSKFPVLPARANTNDPSWTDGYMVPLSVNTVGHLRSTITQDIVPSTSNNSTTPLLALGSFIGTGELSFSVNSIQINIFSDVDSLVNGLQVQQSIDNINWDISDTFSIFANIGFSTTVQAIAKYFRIIYINGIVSQTIFRLQTNLCPIACVLPRSLGQKSINNSLSVTMAADQLPLSVLPALGSDNSAVINSAYLDIEMLSELRQIRKLLEILTDESVLDEE